MTITSLRHRAGPPDAVALEALLSLDDIKDHLRIDHDADDVNLARLRAAAVSRLSGPEGIGVCVAPVDWTLTLRKFSGEIEIPIMPVTAVTAIRYRDSAGTEQTLDPAAYRAALGGDPAVVIPIDAWPGIASAPDAVTIDFVAGYPEGTAPPDLVHALRFLVAHWYEHREPVVVGASVSPMPLSVMALTAPYRRGVVA